MRIIWPTRARRLTGTAAAPAPGWVRWEIWRRISSIWPTTVGDIVAVSGDMQTVIKQRPDPQDPARLLPVENEDQASALLRFAGGAMGTLETSRIACGRKMGLTYVVTGTKGTLSYTGNGWRS